MNSTAPAAPSRCPCIDLVELTGTRSACAPTTVRGRLDRVIGRGRGSMRIDTADLDRIESGRLPSEPHRLALSRYTGTRDMRAIRMLPVADAPRSDIIETRWIHALWGLLALTAQAAVFHTPLPPGQPTKLIVQRVLADGDDYVLQGERDGRTRWLRVAATGGIEASEPRIAAFTDAGVRHASTLRVGPGRFLMPVARAGEECRLSLLDESGDVVWVGSEPGCFDLEALLPGTKVTHDSEAGLWLNSQNTLSAGRIGADGEFAALTLPANGTTWFLLAALRESAAAFALYRVGERAKLARVGREGTAWTWDPPADVRLHEVTTAANDDVWVTGIAGTQPGAETLYLARLTADGVLRFERRFDTWPTLVIRSAEMLAGDRLLIARFHQGSGTALHLLSSTGDLLWSREAEEPLLYDHAVEAATESDTAGPFAYVVNDPNPANPSDANLRWIEYRAADGSLIRIVPGIEGMHARSAVLADGSLIHVDGAGSSRVPQTITHYTPEGGQRAAVALDAGPAGHAEPIAFTVSDEGETFVTATLPGERQIQLLAFAADGTLRWRSELAAVASALYRSGRDALTRMQGAIAVGGNRVCVNRLEGIRDSFSTQPIAPLQCFDRPSGSEVFSTDVAQALAVDAQGNVDRLVVAFCANCVDFRATRIRQNSAGETLNQVTFDTAGLGQSRGEWDFPLLGGPNAVAVFGAAGSASILIGSPQGPLTLLAQQGNQQSRQVVSGGALSGTLVRLLDLGDGLLLLHSWINGVHQLRAIDAQGQVRWNFLAEGGLGNQGADPPFAFDAAASTVVVAVHVVEDGVMHRAITALNAATGATRWQRQNVTIDAREARDLRIDASRGLVLLAGKRPGAMLVEALALDDGRVLGVGRVACSDAFVCMPRALQFEADGTLHLLSNSDLVRIDVDRLLQTADLAQPALTGTWFDPATNGQGMQVVLSPATGNLIAGLFTYSGDDDFGRRGLRWYSLQGRIEPGTKRAVLQIYRNRNGRFDAAPTTVAEQVGSAELSLHGCNQLVVSYQFSSGELAGFDGTMSLLRLTPNTSDCNDVDATILAAQPAHPDLRTGIDRRHGGAWYRPATSGQGVLFDIRPPSADGVDPGVIVGGWFTYDVEGANDDDSSQHWFLLQGDLAEAVGGSTTATIYRASGGRFDQRPTSNVQVVGSVQITFSGCETARLNYRFDDSEVAGSFAGRVGEISLIRLLPCPE